MVRNAFLYVFANTFDLTRWRLLLRLRQHVDLTDTDVLGGRVRHRQHVDLTDTDGVEIVRSSPMFMSWVTFVEIVRSSPMFMMFVEIRTLTMDSLTAGLLQLASDVRS